MKSKIGNKTKWQETKTVKWLIGVIKIQDKEYKLLLNQKIQMIQNRYIGKVHKIFLKEVAINLHLTIISILQEILNKEQVEELIPIYFKHQIGNKYKHKQ